MRTILLLLACNGGGLSSNVAADGGPLPDAAAGTGCAAVTDPAACDARTDCYALWSGDLPCDNISCTNHFVKCADAPADCNATNCTADCVMLMPQCRAGDVNVYQNNCCTIGCASATKCRMVVRCTGDAECGPQAYCRGALATCRSQCQLTIGTAATGICHRSCVDGHCACADDADCPGFDTSCDLSSRKCVSLAPPVCHADCPAGCADGSDIQYGEVCVCGAC